MELYRGIDLDSTNGYGVVSDADDAVAYASRLANPCGNKPYSGLKYGDDRCDARWLARLLRLGVLAEGHIYPKAERGPPRRRGERASTTRSRGRAAASLAARR